MNGTGGLTTLAAAAASLASMGGAPAAPAPGSRPSFDCSRAAGSVERMICSNEELGAYDRALNGVFARARRGTDAAKAVRSQREWLRQERAGCADVDCLANGYAEQMSNMALLTTGDLGPGTVHYSRKAADGLLDIAPIGGGWYAFTITAFWTSHDGNDIHDGGAAGVIKPRAGRAEFKRNCHLTFERLSGDRWRIRDLSVNVAGCDAVNVSMTGIYVRDRQLPIARRRR